MDIEIDMLSLLAIPSVIARLNRELEESNHPCRVVHVARGSYDAFPAFDEDVFRGFDLLISPGDPVDRWFGGRTSAQSYLTTVEVDKDGQIVDYDSTREDTNVADGEADS
uniref:Uncharacterized protein n=1 Tax=Leviviridae sp. TaxID=2027243 RepID=A0A514DAA6_9VIRU|nr:MAG: hypothetical protein H4BulkLitter233719_000002 [Leviviridae sp.]